MKLPFFMKNFFYVYEKTGNAYFFGRLFNFQGRKALSDKELLCSNKAQNSRKIRPPTEFKIENTYFSDN